MLIWFAETTLVASILALVALAVSRLRPISPSVKHALWLVVLIKFITPPLVSWPWAADWRVLPLPAVACQSDGPVLADVAVPEEIAPVAPWRLWPRGLYAHDENRDDDADGDEPEEAAPPVVVASLDEAVPDEDVVLAVSSTSPGLPGFRWPTLPSFDSISRWLLFGWMTVSVVLAIGQSIRIMRFRRRLKGAGPAPDHLIDEADRIGRWLGVSVPELLVVDDLGTPLLWCLGSPRLLLPTRLVKTLSLDRWRGILTHELAAPATARSVGLPARATCRTALVVEPRLLADPRPA